MPLTADRNTAYQDGEVIPVGLAANTKVFGGGMAAVNAAGFGVPAEDAAGLTVIGRFEEGVDNTDGANGGKTVQVRKKKLFHFKNSATNPVSQAHLFKNVYVEDDSIVSSDGGVNNIVAGKAMMIDAAGVWVEIL